MTETFNGPYWPAFNPSGEGCEATGKIQREVPGGLRDVCRMMFDANIDDGTSHRTLQLFAAAPELLEACKHVIDCGMECPGCTTMLRAAIAKAEGRTQ